MSENNVSNVINSTMEHIRTMVDADTIVGTPIVLDSVTLIPVSKVAFGLATGGSDFPSKTAANGFGGGGGAGVTITPVAFIAVKGDNVHMMPVYNQMDTLDKAINMAPEIVDKIASLFKKEAKKDNEQ
jgi:sporulation protein YtfJ